MAKAEKNTIPPENEEIIQDEVNNQSVLNNEPIVEDSSKDPSKDELDYYDLYKAIVARFGEKSTDLTAKDCTKIIKTYIKQIINKHPCSKNYNVIILYDDSTLVKEDADKIYNSITEFTDIKKPLLLVLFSRGGSAASAYLIGKLCREYTQDKFVVSVPRFAKSAATLICCAANEIHMGSLSELGPIDPQINDMPALGLKNAIQHIAELVKTYPESSDMFAKYLQLSLKLINLGYYERVAESAKQYAERLLSTHMSDTNERSIKEIAKNLVYKYKDHSFVIDKGEAAEIFGDSIVKTNTPEYEFGNALYQTFSFIRQIASHYKQMCYFIGNLDSDPTFTFVE